MNGLQHIAEAFSIAKAQQRAALMPYFTLGFPTRPASQPGSDWARRLSSVASTRWAWL